MNDFYDAITVQPEKQKSKKDITLTAAILIAVGGLAFFLGLIFWAYSLYFGYRAFVGDLSESTLNAYNSGALHVTEGDISYDVTGDDIYRLYRYATIEKQAKPFKEQPSIQPDMVLDFGDGSHAKLWSMATQINGKDRNIAQVYYTNSEGKTYGYEMIQVQVDTLKSIFYTYRKEK